MRYATSYDIGDRKRTEGINEDSLAVTVFEQGHRNGYRSQSRTVESTDSERVELPENRGVAVFALADGAGGHEAGDVASYIAASVVCEELAGTALRVARSDPTPFDVTLETSPDEPGDDDLQATIGEAIVTAHRAIIEEVSTTGTSAYTTVVAGIAVGGSLHVGWVGDSRAYLVNRDRESIARLTKDHAVVEELYDRGELDDVEAHVHPRSNEITRALGGTGREDPERATVEVETRTVPLYAEDVLLVTSDGLVDAQTDAPNLYDAYVDSGYSDDVGEHIRERVVTDGDIRDVVLDAESLDSAAASVVSFANDCGGKDNLSAILLQDETQPPTPTDADIALRDVDVDSPVEDRETTIVRES
ncbi:MAG: serine/threonine protein phosphatase PrpC [Haloarculaceae archaeon]|jgi:serine/threonine protein phosphatase PrpC